MNYLFKTSIIICTYNRHDSLKDALDHLLKLCADQQDYEIIIVDNDSKDNTKELVITYTEKFNGKLKYFFEPKIGIPYARNAGINKAKGEIIVFIDDDSMVQEGWLGNLIKPYADNPKIGAVGGRVIDKTEIKYQTNEQKVGVLSRKGKPICNFALDTKQIIEVDWITGSNMSFRREALLKTNGFDTGYVDSFDDLDMSTRIRKFGYIILFNPEAAIIHTLAPRMDGIQRERQLRAVFYFYRNFSYFLIKNFLWEFTRFRYCFISCLRWDFSAMFRYPYLWNAGYFLMSIFGRLTGILFGIIITRKEF